MGTDLWAIGVDLGGTKIDAAIIGESGEIRRRRRSATPVAAGVAAVEAEIIVAVRELCEEADSLPAGVGVGVAGQVSLDGDLVYFAPNLGWNNVPLLADLSQALELPVVITNDVRAAALGEWLHGAGQGLDDIVCLFVGTGIGGGVISGGRMLTGCSNNAGELGHVTVDLHGPACHCGNQGCLEAIAGGWAIKRRAEDAVIADPSAGAALLHLAEGLPERVTAKMVGRLYRAHDPLAGEVMNEAIDALGAGAAGLINAFNPCCLILGGGVIQGMPELIGHIEQAVRRRSLPAAGKVLQVVPGKLQNDAGVIGAATLAMRAKKGEPLWQAQ